MISKENYNTNGHGHRDNKFTAFIEWNNKIVGCGFSEKSQFDATIAGRDVLIKLKKQKKW